MHKNKTSSNMAGPIDYIKWSESEKDKYTSLIRGIWASLVAQAVKNLPVMRETQVRSLSWEDTLEKAMPPHSSTLCLENPMDGGAW